MDYTKLIARTAKIIWTHKVFWYFGFIASLFTGVAHLLPSNIGTPNSGSIENWYLSALGNTTRGDLPSVFAFIVFVGFVFFLVSLTLAAYGNTAVIFGVLQTRKRKIPRFRSLAQEAWRLLGRMISINLLLSLLPFAAVVLIVLIMWLTAVATAGLGIFCILPFVILIIPATFFYVIYAQVVNITVIADGTKIGKALRRGWTIFRNNWGALVIIGLIIAATNLLVINIFNMPLTLVRYQVVPVRIQSTLTILWIPVVTALYAVWGTYVLGLWTLAYSELQAKRDRKPRSR